MNEIALRGQSMYVGATRRYGITASKADQSDITITSATYQRYKDDGTAVDVSAQAAVVNEGEVYAYLPAGSTAGKYYVVLQFYR